MSGERRGSERLVAYVGGYGRSGSTLLDVLLGQHPDVTSLGEVRFAGRHVAEGVIQCGCGEELARCPVWGDADLRRLLGDYERTSREGWRPLVFGLGGRGEGTEGHGVVLGQVFEQLFELTGTRVIVDSSKTAWRAASRPVWLSRCGGYQVKLIHLTRNLRSVMDSVARGENEAMERGIVRRRRLSAVQSAIGWTAANLACLRAGKMIGWENYIRVRFEDLLRDPGTELERIGEFLGIDLSPVIRTVVRDEELSGAHVIGGSRHVRAGPIRFERRAGGQRE